VGTGQLAKLVNNVLFTAHLALAHDALELGRGLGIDPARLGEVIQAGSGASYAVGLVSRMGGLLALPELAHSLLVKDTGIVADVAAAHHAPTGFLMDAADRALAAMQQRRPPQP
jgi:3-hydroxyisobutyrate dehydrogenase-like beta-hydroxyacid dehydrogenase